MNSTPVSNRLFGSDPFSVPNGQGSSNAISLLGAGNKLKAEVSITNIICYRITHQFIYIYYQVVDQCDNYSITRGFLDDTIETLFALTGINTNVSLG